MDTPTDSVEKTDTVTEAKPSPTRKGARFWLIFVALSLSALLTAMEATITSTALPDIIASLGGGGNYIWVCIPSTHVWTTGQRVWPSVAFDSLDGCVYPWERHMSTNIAMLIAGRVIQGVGSAGINVLIETVICDLIPLRQRGNYMSILFGLVSLGTALGPFFGGLLVAHSSWRWCFYITLPVGGLSLAMLVLFLHVNYDQSTALATKLGNLDWLGNALFVAATSSVLVALSWAGSVYPWSSYRVLVPLVLGLAGLAGFLVLEGAAPLAPNPMMPLHLFANRTTATTFVLTFLHGLVTVWALYFLPVYFQGVLGAAPDRSGVMLLPTILIVVPSAILGGLLLTRFGRYKPLLAGGFALMVVGYGLFTLFGPDARTGVWVGYQVVAFAGAGVVIPTLLPAVMASLAERDTAQATGTWAFMRTFGMTWGTAISGTIFNNRADQLARAGAVADAAVAAQLVGGNAYQHATAAFLDALPAATRAQVAIGFAAVAFVLVAVIKEVPLRKELESEFGMVEKTKKQDEAGPSSP
ncbi:Major Facilitator Superfamily protein [Niveomyces insectorum RCEF 264]|uniref:Major Facilitator Superfamily protein n=1 Tax=Niveomyces insectorum RCEF 264 TaxID=1081102 RepID=A0A167TYK5_9HYPO|nr:Major Facilitator Superfamily protein [Niveomyces insectorum RCEF 264]